MSNLTHITPFREDPSTLVPAARALYEQGLTRSQVLQAIYGVDLPLEATLFRRNFVNDDRLLEATWGIHPWELMIPLDAGGPQLAMGPPAYAREARIFAQAPHVLLLGTTGYDEVHYGASLIGYDINELHVGRTTIVGLPLILDTPESGATFHPFGPSLVGVFRDLITRYRALMDRWSASGEFGVSYDDVRELDSQLARIEALQRELDEIGQR